MSGPENQDILPDQRSFDCGFDRECDMAKEHAVALAPI